MVVDVLRYVSSASPAIDPSLHVDSLERAVRDIQLAIDEIWTAKAR